VYIIFAHLVIDVRWAAGIGLVGFLSVLVFAIVHLTGRQYINADLRENAVLAGAPAAMAVAIVQLLYLLCRSSKNSGMNSSEG
jgi:hypothetical protein